MSSVPDSPSAITSEIALPTAGACYIPWPENRFANTGYGRFGPEPKSPLRSGNLADGRGLREASL